MILRTEGLTKSYCGRKAVDSASISVSKGARYTLLGLNGAGKTTIVSMICSLLRPTSGSIYFNEKRQTLLRNELALHIGCVPQNAQIPSHLTVLQFMEYQSSIKGLSGNKDEIIQILSSLGIVHRIHAKIRKLSYGQQRLVCIGQAFLGEPALIVMDEPFSGLDFLHRKAVSRMFSEKTGTTFFICSHFEDELEEITTDYGIIDNGIMLCQGMMAGKGSANIYTFSFDRLPVSILPGIRGMKGVISAESEGAELRVKTSANLLNKMLKHMVDNKAGITSLRSGKSLKDIFLEKIDGFNS